MSDLPIHWTHHKDSTDTKEEPTNLRATSHTRPRARDHYTSSTRIGGKGGALFNWALTISWSRALGSCVKWPLISYFASKTVYGVMTLL